MMPLQKRMLMILMFFSSLFYAMLFRTPALAESLDSQVRSIESTTSGLDPKVLRLALEAYNKAHIQQHLDQQQILTVVDYSLPSSDKRMWVINLRTDRVIDRFLVAHGQGSGGVTPDRFSDQAETHASSLGLMKTGNTYMGAHGYSLRLIGLEPGINDRINSRSIVVHGAPYVNEYLAETRGQVGRSWGCLAVDENKVKPLIETIKGGSLIFAYYPDRHWLNNSSYLP